MSELEIDESFVLWIDREQSQPGQLTGRVEQMRKSLRVAFGSTGELVRFLEHGILELRATADTTTATLEDRAKGERDRS